MDTKRWIAGGAIALGVVVAGTGLAIAGGGDAPLTGPDLEQATAAALEATGGGTVIETEIGDDGAAYGVEIRTGDGRVLEVALDADFQVIGQASDDDAPGADEEGTEAAQTGDATGD